MSKNWVGIAVWSCLQFLNINLTLLEHPQINFFIGILIRMFMKLRILMIMRMNRNIKFRNRIGIVVCSFVKYLNLRVG